MKPESDRRLSDLVSVGLLTRVFPPDVVDEVIAESGRTEQRHRSLPARTMAYFAIGMALHADGSYEDVLGLMTDGLAWSLPDAAPVKLPSKSAIFQARERLGFEPVRALFERMTRPLATVETPGSFLAGRTWEKGGLVPHLRTILDDAGRPMMFINWNTDMGDGWEWSNAEDYPSYIKYTSMAYRMGINEIVYALTH